MVLPMGGKQITARGFDLNIEKVLENWTVAHGIREIIANAIDEQTLSCSADIRIFKDEQNNWHFRDFGRGLKYIHFTQNESEEKLQHPRLIGKFGVGLKDALATFDRNNIGVVIDSQYGHFTIGTAEKYGFNDIQTLHVYISDPIDSNFIGTDFCLSGCTDEDISAAKAYFLCFTQLKLLETTPSGEIYDCKEHASEIYINGIKVADEPNFLFSYNITSLTGTLRKALNRERTNVGRSAYSDRIRAILLLAKDDYVIDALTDNLSLMSKGTQCDEMKWSDVQTRAVKLLSAKEDTVFVTPDQIKDSSGSVHEIVNNSGKKPVFIPANILNKVEGTKNTNGETISTIKTVVAEYNNSFEYTFVSYEQLSDDEKRVYDLKDFAIEFLQSNIKLENIFISETLKPDTYGDIVGLCERTNNRVIIKRSQLKTAEDYLGTLIHELTHFDTGYGDISRAFETILTEEIGKLAAKLVSVQRNNQPTAAQTRKDYSIISQLRSQLQSTVVQMREAETQIKAANTQLEEVDYQLKITRKQLSETKKQSEDYKEQLELSQRHLSTAQAEMQSLQEKLSQVRSAQVETKTDTEETTALLLSVPEIMKDIPSDKLVKLGEKLSKDGHYGAVIEIYKVLCSRDSQNADYYYELSYGYFGKANYDSAIENIKIAISINPDVAVYHAEYGRILVRKMQENEASLELNKALELDENCYVALAGKGEVEYAFHNDREKQLYWLKKGAECKPDNQSANSNYCAILASLGKFSDTIKFALSCLEKFPENENFYYYLAFAFSESDNAIFHRNKDKVFEYLNKAMALSPDNPKLEKFEMLMRIKYGDGKIDLSI